MGTLRAFLLNDPEVGDVVVGPVVVNVIDLDTIPVCSSGEGVPSHQAGGPE
jgi:hypothetical protein